MSEHESLDQQASDELPPDPTTNLSGFVASMAEVADVLKVAADTATGYRQHLIDAGWAEQTASWPPASMLCLHGALHAVLQSFESGTTYVEGPNGIECVQSIPIPRSMVEGWCLIAESGR